MTLPQKNAGMYHSRCNSTLPFQSKTKRMCYWLIITATFTHFFQRALPKYAPCSLAVTDKHKYTTNQLLQAGISGEQISYFSQSLICERWRLNHTDKPFQVNQYVFRTRAQTLTTYVVQNLLQVLKYKNKIDSLEVENIED